MLTPQHIFVHLTQPAYWFHLPHLVKSRAATGRYFGEYPTISSVHHFSIFIPTFLRSYIWKSRDGIDHQFISSPFFIQISIFIHI